MNGAVLPISPDTGGSWPTNPRAGSADRAERKLLATGLRNPFRLTMRPGTDEVWVGDVGGRAPRRSTG